jgi:hypothetical protein
MVRDARDVFERRPKAALRKTLTRMQGQVEVVLAGV